jgi:transcription elongation factor Elf1
MVKKAARGKTDYNVDAETFIRTWQQAQSAQEVADKLNMPKDIVHARASTYRNAGIRLKKMPRHSNKALDVEALNKLIDSLEADIEEGTRRVFAQSPPGTVPPALTTTFFDCPKCSVRTHFREVVLDVNHVLAVDPTRDLSCKGCGHQFTKKESRPFPSGVMRSGWWFSCTKCDRLGFVDVTAEGQPCLAGYPKEVPPPKVKCEHCGEENSLNLADEP